MFGRILLLVFALTVVSKGETEEPPVEIIQRFIFYHGPTMSDTTSYTVDTLHQIFNHPNFIRNRATLLFHFGTGQTLSTPQIHDVIDAYFHRMTHNFIVVNYDDTDDINTDNANAFAAGITLCFTRLFDHGYNSGITNFVGFGLGAQILARSSRQIQNQSNRRHVIGRLSGLEPETLGPINGITIGRLSSADAQFVESIHTDGNGQRGDLESNGHMSFFVNGGVNQPQCTQANVIARWNCNHFFALTYWAEAARSMTPIFPSLLCPSWDQFTSGACNNNQQANMGRVTQTNIRGSFFLRTNTSPPFSRDTALP